MKYSDWKMFFTLEDHFQAEEQLPSSDAVGVEVAGKRSAAVGIERRAQELPGGGVV